MTDDLSNSGVAPILQIYRSASGLRDDGIQFWHAQVYDPAGGFLLHVLLSEAVPLEFVFCLRSAAGE